MQRRFEIIGRDNCPYCDMAQNLLNIRDENFRYQKYTDIEPEAWEKVLRVTGHKTFPFIWVAHEDDEYAWHDFIGGFDKLKEYLTKNEQ